MTLMLSGFATIMENEELDWICVRLSLLLLAVVV